MKSHNDYHSARLRKLRPSLDTNLSSLSQSTGSRIVLVLVTGANSISSPPRQLKELHVQLSFPTSVENIQWAWTKTFICTAGRPDRLSKSKVTEQSLGRMQTSWPTFSAETHSSNYRMILHESVFFHSNDSLLKGKNDAEKTAGYRRGRENTSEERTSGTCLAVTVFQWMIFVFPCRWPRSGRYNCQTPGVCHKLLAINKTKPSEPRAHFWSHATVSWS